MVSKKEIDQAVERFKNDPNFSFVREILSLPPNAISDTLLTGNIARPELSNVNLADIPEQIRELLGKVGINLVQPKPTSPAEPVRNALGNLFSEPAKGGGCMLFGLSSGSKTNAVLVAAPDAPPVIEEVHELNLTAAISGAASGSGKRVTAATPGQPIEIIGKNFSAELKGNELFFGDIKAVCVPLSPTRLIGLTPFPKDVVMNADGSSNLQFPARNLKLKVQTSKGAAETAFRLEPPPPQLPDLFDSTLNSYVSFLDRMEERFREEQSFLKEVEAADSSGAFAAFRAAHPDVIRFSRGIIELYRASPLILPVPLRQTYLKASNAVFAASNLQASFAAVEIGKNRPPNATPCVAMLTFGYFLIVHILLSVAIYAILVLTFSSPLVTPLMAAFLFDLMSAAIYLGLAILFVTLCYVVLCLIQLIISQL